MSKPRRLSPPPMEELLFSFLIIPKVSPMGGNKSLPGFDVGVMLGT
jgi:hypothetical protein